MKDELGFYFAEGEMGRKVYAVKIQIRDMTA